MTSKLTYEDLNLPNYRNTRNVFANLDVSDAFKAGVISALNILAIGGPGTAKTTLMSDIHNTYFNGNKREGGEGVLIRCNPEMDLYNEIFSELDIAKAQRNLTDNIEALLFRADEVNRAPTKTQNQLLALGDGDMDYKGKSIKLGRDGYLLLLATANMGNGRFTGTFDIDPAMYDRMHIVIDLDHYCPTQEDHFVLDNREANPRVKDAPRKDLTQKIIQASKEIARETINPGLEAKAVIDYIRHGLANCMLNAEEGKTSKKGREWPMRCSDCKFNSAKSALCSYIMNSSGRRVTESVIRYAAALQFIAKLKDPEVKIDTIDLMFKSFELVGAYKGVLNPNILAQEYYGNNSLLMSTAVEKLKADFRSNYDYILSSFQEAHEGRALVKFFNHNGKLGDYNSLSQEAKDKHRIMPSEPYTDKREIGMGWMNNRIDYEIKNRATANPANSEKKK
ncbi:MAG: AAA family ATPase [Nanoarchaeota archaeon]|nr:AAA family ATPase [Nanoarchaeota archaeon]